MIHILFFLKAFVLHSDFNLFHLGFVFLDSDDLLESLSDVKYCLVFYKVLLVFVQDSVI